MEVIFPWERDDIIVRSRSEDSPEEGQEGAAFATTLASMASRADNEARIRKLAEGIRSVERTSELTIDEIIANIRAELDEAGSEETEEK